MLPGRQAGMGHADRYDGGLHGFLCDKAVPHEPGSRTQNLHKIISTQPLTVLTIGVIVRIEQREQQRRNVKTVPRLPIV